MNLYLKIELCLNLRRNVDGVGSRASRSQGSASLRQIAETVIRFALQQLNLKPKKIKELRNKFQGFSRVVNEEYKKIFRYYLAHFMTVTLLLFCVIKITSLEILLIGKTEENLINNLSYNCQKILWDILL